MGEEDGRKVNSKFDECSYKAGHRYGCNGKPELKNDMLLEKRS
jgi:hypothetical protein